MIVFAPGKVGLIWNKLITATDLGPDDLLDVSELTDSVLFARIVTNEDLEQTMELHTVARYSSSNNDSTTVVYTRRALNEEFAWGDWEKRD